MSAQAQGEEAARIRAVRWRLGLPLLIAAVGLLAAVPDARAAFHLMKIREVHTGGAANDSYVVLQAYSGGQNFVNGTSVTAYGANGAQVGGFTFGSNVGNGQDQMTILVADTAYSTTFPSPAPAPDGTSATLELNPAGGAVCFENIDCVSWGSFDWGANPQPSPTGAPASPGGVAAGKALHRSIEPGCPTLLEFGDDTNGSSTDFSEQLPNPRSNASPIVETKCVAPNTTITSATVPNGGRTNETTISFSFSATPSEGASFECKLDAGAFEASCTSPKEYTSLDGDDSASGTPHAFQVRAKNADGTDPTPATHNWTVDTVAPTMTITGMPEDQSSGASAAFAYQANESVASTQCRLDTPEGAGAFEGCPPGSKTYTGLGDGLHTFMVRATDLAGNQSIPGAFPAGTYSWTVDNSLADTTSPETTITSMPPNPSGSSTASFTYESNEPGSSFKCKLDAAPFAACSALGITYTGLADGTHTFQVRATDSSDNTDPTPAGYTFDVVLPLTSDPLPLPSPPPPSEPEPGTASAAAVAQVRGAFALLRIGCRGQQGARCRGLLRLVARVGSAGSSRSGARLVTVGRGRYNLPAGSRGRVVRARLTPQGRRLVRRAGRRGLRVRLVGKRLEKRVLTLRGAAKRKRTKR